MALWLILLERKEKLVNCAPQLFVQDKYDTRSAQSWRRFDPAHAAHGGDHYTGQIAIDGCCHARLPDN
jgi:hypothetical protein